MKLVETHALSVTLRGGGIPHTALNKVSVCIEAGQHTALLGPNGAGKSTLLKVLHGAQWPDTPASPVPTPHAGTAPTTSAVAPPVTWFPPPHEKAETSPLVGRAISALVSAAQHEQYVRQEWNLSGTELLLTGFDDSPLLYTLPQPKQEQRVQNLARTLQLEHLLTQSITTLSQGQMRLLLVARALVRQPALLLLDECLDGLDPVSRERVLEVLEEVRHTSTIIVSSHRWHSLPAWIRTTLHMQGGRVCSQPAAFASPASPTPTAQLGLTSQIDSALSSKSPTPTTSPLSNMQSAPSTPAPYPPRTTTPPPLVALKNVNVYVERAHILHDITWCIRQGEHWVLRGANGSGKSTLLRLIAGDEYPALGGSIERHLPRSAAYTGEPTEGVEAICELERLRRGIRLVSDAVQAGYDYDLSAQELVLSGFDGSVGLYRDFSPAEQREATYWLQRVGMADMAKRTLRSVSTGQARRLFIARALVGRPDILLLDEPCSGLDSQSRAEVLDLLSGLAADNIHTVLVSHHGEDRLTSSNRQGTVVDGHLQVEV